MIGGILISFILMANRLRMAYLTREPKPYIILHWVLLFVIPLLVYFLCSSINKHLS